MSPPQNVRSQRPTNLFVYYFCWIPRFFDLFIDSIFPITEDPHHWFYHQFGYRNGCTGYDHRSKLKSKSKRATKWHTSSTLRHPANDTIRLPTMRSMKSSNLSGIGNIIHCSGFTMVPEQRSVSFMHRIPYDSN